MYIGILIAYVCIKPSFLIKTKVKIFVSSRTIREAKYPITYLQSILLMNPHVDFSVLYKIVVDTNKNFGFRAYICASVTLFLSLFFEQRYKTLCCCRAI